MIVESLVVGVLAEASLVFDEIGKNGQRAVSCLWWPDELELGF